MEGQEESAEGTACSWDQVPSPPGPRTPTATREGGRADEGLASRDPDPQGHPLPFLLPLIPSFQAALFPPVTQSGLFDVSCYKSFPPMWPRPGILFFAHFPFRELSPWSNEAYELQMNAFLLLIL